MFNWGRTKKSVKDLEAEVLRANDEVVLERQARIEAEIALSKRNATHASNIEEIRAENEGEVARLNREIEVLHSDKDDAVTSIVNSEVARLEKIALQERISTKKELRAEFGSELDTAKKAVASLTTESAKNKGLYDGALLVIQALQGQLKDVNALNATLIKALPTVSASITTPNPSVIVGSGNKS